MTSPKSNMRALKKTAARQVWSVALLGDLRVGKSTLVQQLMRQAGAAEPDWSGSSVNMVEVQFPNGQSRRVIFTEVQTMDLADPLKDVVLDQNYDAVCICFDHPNYLKKLLQEQRQHLRHATPKLAVFCKNDERQFDRRALETKEFGELGVTVFAECSAKNGKLRSFLTQLFEVVENP